MGVFSPKISEAELARYKQEEKVVVQEQKTEAQKEVEMASNPA